MKRTALVAVVLALGAGIIAVVWREALLDAPQARLQPSTPAMPPALAPSAAPTAPTPSLVMAPSAVVTPPAVVPSTATTTTVTASPSVRAPRTPRKDVAPSQRGQVFSSLMARYMTPETLPAALGIVDDTCQQQHSIVVDEAKRYEDALDHHQPYDRDGALAAARQVADLYHDMQRSLAALPGSKFDKAALKELLASVEYQDNCTKLKEPDDAD